MYVVYLNVVDPSSLTRALYVAACIRLIQHRYLDGAYRASIRARDSRRESIHGRALHVVRQNRLQDRALFPALSRHHPVSDRAHLAIPASVLTFSRDAVPVEELKRKV